MHRMESTQESPGHSSVESPNVTTTSIDGGDSSIDELLKQWGGSDLDVDRNNAITQECDVLQAKHSNTYDIVSENNKSCKVQKPSRTSNDLNHSENIYLKIKTESEAYQVDKGRKLLQQFVLPESKYIVPTDLNTIKVNKAHKSMATQTPKKIHTVITVNNTNRKRSLFRRLTFKGVTERQPPDSQRFKILRPINNREILKRAVQCCNNMINELARIKLEKERIPKNKELLQSYTEEIKNLTTEIQNHSIQSILAKQEIQQRIDAEFLIKCTLEEKQIEYEKEKINNNFQYHEIQEYRERNRDLEEKLLMLKNKMQETIEIKDEQIISMETDRLTLQNLVTNNEKIIVELREQCKLLKNSSDEKDESKEILKEKYFKLSEEHKVTCSTLFEIKEKTITENSSSFDELKNERNKFHHQLILKNEEISHLKNLLISLKEKDEDIKILKDKIERDQVLLAVLKERVGNNLTRSTNHNLNRSNFVSTAQAHELSEVDRQIEENNCRLEASRNRLSQTLDELSEDSNHRREMLGELNSRNVDDNEIKRLEDESCELKRQLALSNNDLDVCRQENTDIMRHAREREEKLAQHEDILKENLSLNANLIETKEKLKLLESLASMNKQNIKFAQNIVGHYECNKKECCFKIKRINEGLDAEVERLVKEVKDLNDDANVNRCSKKALKILQEKFDDMKEDYEGAQKMIKQLKQQHKHSVTKQQHKHSVTKQQHKHDVTYNNEDEVQNQQVINVHLDMKGLSKNIEYSNVMQQVHALTAQIVSLQEEKQEYLLKIERLKNLNRNTRVLKNTIEHLQTENQRLKLSVETQESRLGVEDLKVRNKQLGIQTKNLLQNLDEMKMSLKHELDEKDEDSKQYELKLNEKDILLIKQEELNRGVKEELKDLKEKFSELTLKGPSDFRKEILVLKTRIAELVSSKQFNETTIKSLKDEKSELLMNVGRLETENNDLKQHKQFNIITKVQHRRNAQHLIEVAEEDIETENVVKRLEEEKAVKITTSTTLTESQNQTKAMLLEDNFTRNKKTQKIQQQQKVTIEEVENSISDESFFDLNAPILKRRTKEEEQQPLLNVSTKPTPANSPAKSVPSWLRSIKVNDKMEEQERSNDVFKERSRRNVLVRKNNDNLTNNPVFMDRNNKPIKIKTGGLLGDANDFLSLEAPPGMKQR